MVQQKTPEVGEQTTQETLQEERYLWMARCFSLVALLTFIANFLLIIALFGLVPLVRVQPYYIQTQDKDQQVVFVDRPPKEELRSKILKESLIRKYLIARYAIGSNIQEVQERWGSEGMIHNMSVQSVYQEFFEKESIDYLRRAETEGLTRDVKINYVNEEVSETAEGVSKWVAEIELRERNQTISTEDITTWYVELLIQFQPNRKKITWAQRLRNPLGFQVTAFSRHERPSGEKGIR